MKKQLTILFLLLMLSSVSAVGWWDSGFADEINLNITGTHSDINTAYTFQALNVDSSTWSCSNDNNKMAMVDKSVNNEIDMVVHGSCGSDLNIYWKSQFGIPADQAVTASDTNGYKIYVSNDAISDVNRTDENVFSFVDGFEDNNYLTNVEWELYEENSTPDLAVAINAENQAPKSGTYVFKVTAANNEWARIRSPCIDCNKHDILTLGSWMMTNNVDGPNSNDRMTLYYGNSTGTPQP